MREPAATRPLTEETLFADALALPPERRSEFVQQQCATHGLEVTPVLALLESHRERGAFLDVPAPEAALRLAMNAAATPPEPAPGDSIGRYRLLERIGEGGFGLVYVAEQREPVRRRVALKLIRLGMDTREFVARFEAERQALALMDHPNIARVFDAGATESGRPYLVMELVRGVPITKYCDEHKLPLRARLELFIAVCGAIQHAHQKGVIHRDLKPSNILVAREGDAHVPKVIDFGIAKAVAGPLTDKTLFTQGASFMGTPTYASPEQMELGMQDVDTRSDVYALGALLYELLTGSPPFERAVLEKAGFDEMRRTIREVEPMRPSVRVGGSKVARASRPWSGTDQTETRAGRPCHPDRTEPRAGRPCYDVPDDLDWIVMRCLEKDRTRRYETASALALDLRRHLENEPVVARPPSRGYRLRKYIRRHRTPVFAAAAVAVSLVGGLVAAGVTLVREKAARTDADAARQAEATMRQQADLKAQQARAAADKSRQVAQFMKTMLGSVGPSVARGRDTVLLREVLDDTIRRLDTELRDQPEVAADLRHTLGVAFHEIGEYERAATLWREAIAARRALGDNSSAELAATLHALGSRIWRDNQVEEAERALEEALRIREQTLGPEHFDVGTTLAALGENMGSPRSLREREDLLRRAVAIQRAHPGREDGLAETLRIFGFILTIGRDHAEAVRVLRDAVAIQRRLYGDSHPRLAETLGELAYTLRNRNTDNPESLQLRREALQIVRQVRGAAHAKLVAALLWFAMSRFPAETLSSDLRLAREIFAELSEVLPAGSPDLAAARIALASMLDLDPAHATEAESLTREGVAQLQRARAHGHTPHRDTSAAMQFFVLSLHTNNRLKHARPMGEELNADKEFGSVQRFGPPVARFLGYIYYDLGLYDQALPLLEHSALSENEPMWRPVGRAHRLIDFAYWGDTLRKLGELAQSRRVLQRGLDRKFAESSDEPQQRARGAVRGELGYTALAEGKAEDAEKLFVEALRDYDAGPVANRWDDFRPRGRVKIGLGLALAAQGKFAAAESEIVGGFSALKAQRETLRGDPTRLLRESHEAVVKFYRDWGRPEKVAEWEAKRSEL